jgi:hypothetical protein
MEESVKLVVFVPVEAEQVVRMAMGRAGAGRIGDYDYCSFVTHGTGHFRPRQGSSPYVGKPGEIEDVPECRIETVCSKEKLPAVLQAMRETHPYEEIAYDILPLINHTIPSKD